ncbi:unnamed protein product [Aphanomyces euteiches]
MTQGQNEHIKAFFVRFNAAAWRIRFDYRKSRESLEEHIDRFARNVRSRVLADAINTQQFRSIDEFEDYLDKQQQKEAIDRFQTRAKSAQPSASQPPLPVGDRSKTRKSSVQFMDMEALDDSYQAEIFALGRYMALPSVSNVKNVVASTLLLMVNVGPTFTVLSAPRWDTQRPTATKTVPSVSRHTTNMSDVTSGRKWQR